MERLPTFAFVAQASALICDNATTPLGYKKVKIPNGGKMEDNQGANEVIQEPQAEEQGRPKRKLPKWLLIGSPVALVAIVAATLFLLVPSPEETYLSKLSEQGLGGIYASDAQALAAGNAECRRLNDGGDPSGTPEKFVAVEVFCDEFASGYRVLNEIKVIGTMTVMDDKVYERTNGECYIPDSSGYDDMNEGREVVITNEEGERLTTAKFGPGEGAEYLYCTFEFEFTVLEGEREYIVEVGRRGSLSYSESELKTPGSVALSIG
jgi:hypothetical protein